MLVAATARLTVAPLPIFDRAKYQQRRNQILKELMSGLHAASHAYTSWFMFVMRWWMFFLFNMIR